MIDLPSFLHRPFGWKQAVFWCGLGLALSLAFILATRIRFWLDYRRRRRAALAGKGETL